ncbi:MAG: succinate dehydrogenase, cytochrome b556 subunit [Pseudomonadota bacterium]
MSQNTTSHARPLSPHLQIYRWQNTMILSILHRASGVAMVAGTLLLVTWLSANAYDPAFAATLNGFLAGFIGKLMLFGWSAAFYFHLCNGVRYLLLDSGKFFSVENARIATFAVAGTSGFLTLLTWIIVLGGSK